MLQCTECFTIQSGLIIKYAQSPAYVTLSIHGKWWYANWKKENHNVSAVFSLFFNIIQYQIAHGKGTGSCGILIFIPYLKREKEKITI